MTHRRSQLSTRVLLVCGALATAHVLLHLATVTLLTALAPMSPPLYGAAASIHGLMLFLARRITRAPGTATITAGLSGMLIAVTSPAGIILLAPILLSGVTIDVIAGRVDVDEQTGRRVEFRYAAAGVVLGLLLFLLSLTVFSADHLTPLILGCTLVARIVGEVTVAAVSGALARALWRAGIRGGSGADRTSVNA